MTDNLVLVESITSLANGDEANNDAPDSNPPFPLLPTLESLALPPPPLPKCLSNIRSLADHLRRSLVEEEADAADVL
jgi:hypothetical protein